MTTSMFGSRLKAARKAKGLTQQDLSVLVDLVVRSIASYELGETSPNAEILVKLCGVLDCSADFLLGVPPHPPTIASPPTSEECA